MKLCVRCTACVYVKGLCSFPMYIAKYLRSAVSLVSLGICMFYSPLAFCVYVHFFSGIVIGARWLCANYSL